MSADSMQLESCSGSLQPQAKERHSQPVEPRVMAMDILWRIRERAYQLWEQEGRPEGRHLDRWLQAEHELVAENAMDFEFKQLMRAYRNGIISETTVEQVMTELEKRALSNGRSFSRRQGDLPD
jgi:Protein of unknown function (DUF2934)